MTTEERVAELEKKVAEIESRNKKVEADKAWETSLPRRIIVAILTYFVIVFFMIYIKIENPMSAAIIPTLGFILSTLSLSYLQRIWVEKNP